MCCLKILLWYIYCGTDIYRCCSLFLFLSFPSLNIISRLASYQSLTVNVTGAPPIGFLLNKTWWIIVSSTYLIDCSLSWCFDSGICIMRDGDTFDFQRFDSVFDICWCLLFLNLFIFIYLISYWVFFFNLNLKRKFFQIF